MKNNRFFIWFKNEYALLTSKKYSTIAGTLVYFFIMSVVPFAFWLTLLCGRFVDYEAVLRLKVFAGVEELIGYIFESARSAADGAGAVLLVTTLYSSTNLFYHIRLSGELIYDCGRGGGIRLRLLALALMFAVILSLSAVVAVFSAAYYFISKYIGGTAADVAAYLLLAAAAFLFAVILNVYICPLRVKFKEVALGAAVTTVLWALAAVGFGVYLSFAGASKLYGAVSAVIVFLLWLYIMMSCFIIGVIFNSDRILRAHGKIRGGKV